MKIQNFKFKILNLEQHQILKTKIDFFVSIDFTSVSENLFFYLPIYIACFFIVTQCYFLEYFLHYDSKKYF